MAEAGDTGVVTPEAVRLDFEEASVGSRAVAVALDWLVQLTTLLVGSFGAGLLLQGVGPGLPPWVGISAIVLLSFVVLFGYPIAFETLARGRTPGKMAMGLRVVTVEGAPVGFRHAAIRAALGLVDFALTSGFVAVITALVSKRHQRLGDHLAGTVVVRERTGAGSSSAAAFAVPRGYEGYASTIDAAGMRPGDYQAVRAFLLRADDLRPERRAAIGERLASGLAQRLSHTIPPGVHPEAFLLCAAARYQGRGVQAGREPLAGEHLRPAPAVPGPDGSQPQERDSSGDGSAADAGRRTSGGFAAPD